MSKGRDPAEWRGKTTARLNDLESGQQQLAEETARIETELSGRLTALERWKERVKGGLAVLSLVGGGAALNLIGVI